MELADIKGLKEKRIVLLNKVGIYTPGDLLLRFPYHYLDIMAPFEPEKIADGAQIAFIGRVFDRPYKKFVRKGLSFVKAKFETLNSKTTTCTWFNQPYIANQLKIDSIFVVCGKVKKSKNLIEISAPTIIQYKNDNQRILPLYKSIKGLPTSLFCEAVKEVLSNTTLNGYFDNYIIEKYSLMPLDKAIRALHFPTSIDETVIAGRTVALENLAHLISIYNILKQNNLGVRAFNYADNRNKLTQFIKNLSFELTDDQTKALGDILTSLHKDNTMNRLLQGDVGSGKTIIAFLAMYYAALSGYQSVLMAPTEILARQHYINALKLFEGTDINIEFLSGSLNKIARETNLFNIKNGLSQIVIGTHSVLSENVVFNKLALVITDEQHRFGVAQRGNLENKSVNADKLVMSATPIPRTLALTIYGDLEQSLIKTMPKNRAKITTRFVPQNKIEDMYEYIKRNAAEGLQTYIVCPRVEDEEESELTSAEKLYKELLPKFKDNIALLHGQMHERDKKSVMDDFADGKVKIIVTTTVIEVGIDVKNAVNIVIYDADRYGLSQLHQLRGRVGRGEKESFCFLLCPDLKDAAKERVEYFIKCQNGFELAEYDFSTRGAGDFLGTRQHGAGEVNAGLIITPQLLSTAKEISDYLLSVPRIRDDITIKATNEDNGFIKSLTLN